MKHGVISRTIFSIGPLNLWIDYEDSAYYGKSTGKYYVPSRLIDDCWGIDFTKQFRTFEACKTYITKCVIKTCKQILKDS